MRLFKLKNDYEIYLDDDSVVSSDSDNNHFY